MRRALLAVLVLALVAASCGGGAEEGERRATPEAALTDVTDVEVVRTAFNADHGSARLILLLSPT